MNKTCKQCAKVKHIDQFHRNRTLLDGRSKRCISCTAANVARKKYGSPDISALLRGWPRAI